MVNTLNKVTIHFNGGGMRKKDSEYTAKYVEKRQAKRYTIDLYLDDEQEKAIAEILESKKVNKQLKSYILNTIKNFENNK